MFASQTIASYWLPSRLMRFHASHPGIDLTLTIGNTRTVADAVISGEADGSADVAGLLQAAEHMVGSPGSISWNPRCNCGAGFLLQDDTAIEGHAGFWNRRLCPFG